MVFFACFLPLADSTWPAPAEGENQLPSTTQTSKMPPTKNSEASPVSDITPPQNDPVGTITEGEEYPVTLDCHMFRKNQSIFVASCFNSASYLKQAAENLCIWVHSFH